MDLDRGRIWKQFLGPSEEQLKWGPIKANPIQHCMYDYDEENCDLIEFNECEDDEYRCMNGMCIPD
jgi:hypothetical protein